MWGTSGVIDGSRFLKWVESFANDMECGWGSCVLYSALGCAAHLSLLLMFLGDTTSTTTTTKLLLLLLHPPHHTMAVHRVSHSQLTIIYNSFIHFFNSFFNFIVYCILCVVCCTYTLCTCSTVQRVLYSIDLHLHSVLCCVV